MARELHLALVAQDFPPSRGGIQTYAAELARVWATECRSFCVLAPAAQGAREWDAQCGYEVKRVPAGAGVFALAVSAELARLGPRWRTFHTQWFSALPALGLRRVRRLGSVFVAAHGREILLRPWSRMPFFQRRYDAARRSVLRNVDEVFAVSRYTAGLVQSTMYPPREVRVVCNGTDPDWFLPGDRERARRTLEGLGKIGARAADPLFLSVARLVPRKGVQRVVGALREVLAAAPSAELAIVGEGPERGNIERAVQAAGLRSRVNLWGALGHEELRLAYQAADVFVLPAKSEEPDVEGFGIAYLEASACGLPVIGPNCGGPLDAIEADVTGLCIDPDDPSALAAAMTRLATDAALRRSLGARGRQRVLASFRWHQVACSILDQLEHNRLDVAARVLG